MTVLEGSAGWEVARPARPSRVSGVDMAGFGVAGPLAGGLRMVPHPAAMLVLEIGARDGTVVDDGAGHRQRGSLAAGPGFGAGGRVRAWGEDVECVQVRLSPVVAGRVLGVGPAEPGAGAVPLADLWGPSAVHLAERLGELPSWQDRFALVDEEIARRCARRPPVEAELAWAWQRLVAGRGLVRVDALAAELGWSRKRLWARFGPALGMTPKRAARLVRFDHAVHRIVAGADAARVAADGGYCDQSHLIRDIKEFTGVTPASVVDEPFLTVDDRAWPTG